MGLQKRTASLFKDHYVASEPEVSLAQCFRAQKVALLTPQATLNDTYGVGDPPALRRKLIPSPAIGNASHSMIIVAR